MCVFIILHFSRVVFTTAKHFPKTSSPDNPVYIEITQTDLERDAYCKYKANAQIEKKESGERERGRKRERKKEREEEIIPSEELITQCISIDRIERNKD